MSEPGKIAFDAYWETPSARWDEMSDMGKAKWAQAEAKIVAAFTRTDERVRHVKRGSEYEVLFRGVELQATTVLENEGVDMVVYRGADGKLWTRSEDEFDDGRFVPVS